MEENGSYPPWTITGLSGGLFFAVIISVVAAAGLDASAPSPFNITVRKATRHPDRNSVQASAISKGEEASTHRGTSYGTQKKAGAWKAVRWTRKLALKLKKS